MTLNDQKVGPIACVCSFDVSRNPIGLIRGGQLRDPTANRRWGGCWVTRRSEGFFEENWRERLRTVNTEVIWDGTIFCRTRCIYWRRYIVCRMTTDTVNAQIRLLSRFLWFIKFWCQISTNCNLIFIVNLYTMNHSYEYLILLNHMM